MKAMCRMRLYKHTTYGHNTHPVSEKLLEAHTKIIILQTHDRLRHVRRKNDNLNHYAPRPAYNYDEKLMNPAKGYGMYIFCDTSWTGLTPLTELGLTY